MKYFKHPIDIVTSNRAAFDLIGRRLEDYIYADLDNMYELLSTVKWWLSIKCMLQILMH